MAIRLAFTGASGTGKSTLAEKIAKEYDLPMNPVGSRTVSKAMGFETPYDVDKAGKRGEFQHRLLQEKTKWEAEREDFITDRTTFDNLSYTVLHDVHCIDQKMLDGAISGLSRYTHIVYCPVRAFCNPGSDPNRVKEMIYHVLYDAILEALHQKFGNSSRFLTLEISGVDNRLGTIRTWLANT